ncbi:MAG: DotA/TraY family protein, partial [Francisellaceae bacterium]|nr:DotA/TraY family protein [Francisellaceae bacterium]
MRIGIFIILYLIASPAVAGVFEVVPSDQSLRYLAQLFGGQVGNVSLGAGTAPALSAMFEKFNLIVSTVGILILGYITILSTVNTAQEGSAMGKKFSGIWTPFRSVTGMILLVPSPSSGYSMIQSLVMWIILQSIGAANTIWNVVLEQNAAGRSAVKIAKMTGAADGKVSTVPGSSQALQNLFPGGKTYDGVKNPIKKGYWPSIVCMYGAHALATGHLPFVEPTDSKTIKNVNLLRTKGNQIQFYLGDIDASSSDSDFVVATGNVYIGVQHDTDAKWQSMCGKRPISVSTLAKHASGPALTNAQAKSLAITNLETKF